MKSKEKYYTIKYNYKHHLLRRIILTILVNGLFYLLGIFIMFAAVGSIGGRGIRSNLLLYLLFFLLIILGWPFLLTIILFPHAPSPFIMILGVLFSLFWEDYRRACSQASPLSLTVHPLRFCSFYPTVLLPYRFLV